MVVEPSLVISVVAAVVSAAIGVAMGRARGVDNVARRADSELRKLVDALSARAELLETLNLELKDDIDRLEKRVAELEHDLHLERAVSARIKTMTEGT